MKYRLDRYGNKLSLLGFGCMRFPSKLGRIDMEMTERLILQAVRGGINYFDTAYIYPGSETALGEIIEKNGLREQVKIATKLPHYLLRDREQAERIFQEELARLRTDRIDYYLLHMLTDLPSWERLCRMGIDDWLKEKVSLGQIGQIGFSYHGNALMFQTLLDVFDWDFTMVQYNYMDEHSQAGRSGVKKAYEKGIPVMVMEPLRGGRLVTHLPEEAKEIFRTYEKQYSPAAWSFRWLWDQKEICVVLSGMNSEKMLAENIQTASLSEQGEMTPSDQRMLREAARAINSRMKVACTGCAYCMPCPRGVDIPGVFSAYNRRFSEGKFSSLKEYFMCTALRKNATAASSCIGCGKCEAHCPQAIPIREKIKEVKSVMEGPIYQTARVVARKVMKF